MGALHAGHASLIEAAATECDEVAVSIFVNPAQFGEGEDFERYPRSLEKDYELAHAAGAQYIWTPTVEKIYPNYPEISLSGDKTGDKTASGPLAHRWEGEHRPGHFTGVVAVVKRLFDLIQPDKAYFGEKDFQQLRIIEDMTQRLSLPVEIVRCLTVRDKNGLALSSRNRYLSAEELSIAQSIPRALNVACVAASGGEKDPTSLLSAAKTELDSRIQLDYLSIVDEADLTILESLDCKDRTSVKPRIIFAGRINATRLIDNMPL